MAAIEAAVADGMDVINLSLGEPEIEPSRDIVVAALSAAARAGVVPVVAAGNDFDDFGSGSVSSPGSTPEAITVGAVSTTRSGPPNVIADFSSGGPTPLSLQLKPEVSAPGVAILSAAPNRNFVTLSGTSMAAPHVAGAVALLRQRHPTWTPAQVKAALALTGDTAFGDGTRTVGAPTTRQGGGVVSLRRADTPLLFASPVALSFGLVPRGASLVRRVALTDSGGGSGDWTVGVEHQTGAVGVTVGVPATITVPGTLSVNLTTAANAPDSEVTGFVVLTRGADRRRIPFWLRVSVPALAGAKPTPLVKPGARSATTRGGASLVSRYRYPESPDEHGFETNLAGPERVYRVTVTRPASNFGVVVTSRAKGVRVEPRIVHAGNENRLTGYAALPFNLNPYLRGFEDPVLAAGVLRPARGAYDVVFDSPGAGTAGAFAFRYWVDDVKPPDALVPDAGRPPRHAARDLGHGRGLGCPSGLARPPDRRPRARRQGGGRRDPDPDRRPRPRPPLARAPALRLPGDAQQRERPADPPEHGVPADELHRPLAAEQASGAGLSPRSSGGRRGRAGRSRANSSLSERISFRFAFRFWRARASRASLPRRPKPRTPERRCHSAPARTTSASARSTMKGQLT